MATVAAASLAVAAEINVPEQGDLRTSAVPVDPFFDSPPPYVAFGTYPTVTIKSVIDRTTDVDWYSFKVKAGRSFWLDIDNDLVPRDPLFPPDPMLSLFDSAGTLLAFGDNSPLDPGSGFAADPFIGTYTPASDDTYFAAVTGYPNRPYVLFRFICADFASLTRPDGAFGGVAFTGCPTGNDLFLAHMAVYPGPYALLISSEVPEPGTLSLLGIGLLGGLLASRWRSSGAGDASQRPRART